MGYKVHNVQYLSESDMLLHLKKGAELYLKYADTDLLFIYRESVKKKYEFYEIHFGKRNFMHLTGIKAATMNAEEFLEACALGMIRKDECIPVHSAHNMHSKISVLDQLLDLQHSKCYKIGEKDLVTKDNDFEMAIGNARGIVGYDRRVSKRGTKEIDKNFLPVPTTLLTNPITDYTSNPQKIMFIMQKDKEETYYKKVFFEIKHGLLEQEKYFFSEELRKMLEEKKDHSKK